MDRRTTPLLQALEHDLGERVAGGPRAALARADGELVLLWIRGAMRADANPALEAAVQLAHALDLPLLAYQALDDRHPYASDRVWRFVLEGAQDLARDLDARGIEYAFHLVGPGERPPALVELAERSAVVVADAHPVEPVRGWTRRLRERTSTPVLEVDASCVVPLTATTEGHERAFGYRSATVKARQRWLGWLPAEGDAPARFTGELPFRPLDLGKATDTDLDAWIAACRIDHGIAPIAHTRGGSTAGLARWRAFREHGLGDYAKARNDALRDGVSRMSPYFHFGMVSPLRVAREARESGGAGSDKYLDELLVWREVAWHWCHHRGDVDSVSSVPEWARATLAAHGKDAREALYSWAQLAAAETGDELWDACQRSLLRHGELHNNVRMTWGKALLGWTPNAAVALARLIDLNHRYALDGRDPASYGGLLWCLGLFDRPFTPELPVLGSVRPRPTAQHAQRLDVAAYGARTAQPSTGEPLRIAIIGAGMAGLSAARALDEAGHGVAVFDKGRGVGGRTATRRSSLDDGTTFDHGAQYFTARDPRFRRYVDAWVEEGVAAPWSGRVRDRANREAPDRFVGVPGMTAMAKRMAEGLTVRTSTRVRSLTRAAERWTLEFEDDAPPIGGFDAVLVTAPPRQASPLVAASERLRGIADSVTMDPCWAAMIAFEHPVDTEDDGLFVRAGALSWAARNGSKPGRGETETWVLHATPEWTREHLELDRADAAAALMGELAEALGVALPATLHADAHRWMFSAAVEPRDDGAAFDAELGLGLAGDWLAGSKGEGAWLSGRALAGHVAAWAVRRSRAGSPATAI